MLFTLLNPLRTSVVKALGELDVYPWTGHSVLDWQERDYVLRQFGKREGRAIQVSEVRGRIALFLCREMGVSVAEIPDRWR